LGGYTGHGQIRGGKVRARKGTIRKGAIGQGGGENEEVAKRTSGPKRDGLRWTKRGTAWTKKGK